MTQSETKLYVVIYDSKFECCEDTEQYYGYFDTPENARLMFYSVFKPNEVRNVKLCQIIETWQGGS